MAAVRYTYLQQSRQLDDVECPASKERLETIRPDRSFEGHSPSTKRGYHVLLPLMLLGVVVGGVILILKFQWMDHSYTDGFLVGTCVNSPARSRARGCVFDPMMYNWVSEACYWQELSDKYFTAGNWTFFADSEGRHPISEDRIRSGSTITAWVTGDFHHSHCAYILHKRLKSEDEASVVLDSKSRSVAHTEHCFMWLSKPKPQVFDLVTLNFSRESLGCISGRLSVDCYSPEGAEVCWPGQGHSIEHHAVEQDHSG